jgi:hypothetical protein
LGIGDKVVHQQSKAISKYLKDDLCNGMNNTNKRKIRDVLHLFLFWKDGNVSGVDIMDYAMFKEQGCHLEWG